MAMRTIMVWAEITYESTFQLFVSTSFDEFELIKIMR